MGIHIDALQWSVYKHYEIVDGKVVGFGSLSNARKYYPFDQPELPNALAKTDPDDDQQILEFVHRYGVLGGSPEDDGSRQAYDPIEWIRLQIKIVRLLMEMVKCSADNDDMLAKRLCSEEEWQKGYFGNMRISDLVIRTGDSGNIPSGLTDNTAVERVRHMMCSIINANVKGITRKSRVLPNGQGTKSDFYFSTLLDVIFWQIQNASEGGTEIGRCMTCQTPFIKTDARQKFCPKQFGEKESRCGMVYHQRHRNKK